MADKFKELPNTLQGLILYRDYAARQIKVHNAQIKKMELFLNECNKRIRIKQGVSNDASK